MTSDRRITPCGPQAEATDRMDLAGLRATVMGLGLFSGGVAVTRWLVGKGAQVTVTDLRPADELTESVAALDGLGVKLVLGEHREELFRSADLVVVNPAVPPTSPYLAMARESGVRLTSEIRLFFERVSSPVTGVTGSNGKSTTTALTHHILQIEFPSARIGGNIGQALIEEVEEIRPEDRVVLELSSFP